MQDEQTRSARDAEQSPFDRADQIADADRQSDSAGSTPQLGSAETGFRPEVGDSPAGAGWPQLERAARTMSLPQAGAGICRAAAERAANAAASAAASSVADGSNELPRRHSDEEYSDSSAIPGFIFPVAQCGRF